ncbi:hypothetical protein HG531_010074 [Fusarium graminearum]|nr:hypothetical protein HG531_010074 [Fusarium graminearum]
MDHHGSNLRFSFHGNRLDHCSGSEPAAIITEGLSQQSFRFPNSALGASYIGKKHTVSGKSKLLDIGVRGLDPIEKFERIKFVNVDNPICTTRCEETPIRAWREGLAIGTKAFQLPVGIGVKEGEITIEICDCEKVYVGIGIESKRDDDMRARLSTGEFLATFTSVSVLFHVP